MQNAREDRAANRHIAFLLRAEALLRKITSKNRIVSLLVLALVPAFVLFVGFRMLRSREDVAEVRAQNLKIQQQIDALDAQSKEYIAVLNDDDPDAFRDYIIRIAREQLGLSLPGDQVYIDRSFVQAAQSNK